MMTGFAATALGAASIGLGIGQATTYDNREADLSTAWPFLLSGGALVAAGVPMFAVGALNESDADRARAQIQVQRTPGQRHSIAMAATGGVFVGLAGLSALFAQTVVALDLANESFPLASLVVAAPAEGVAVALSGIGVPLLVVGLHRDGVPIPASVPTFTPGPGGVSATWRMP